MRIFLLLIIIIGRLGSVVGIATGYGMDDRGVGVRVPVGSRIFFTSSRPTLGPTQLPIQWVPGALSPG
jgi:ABC-type lipoprotein release transport system permease subunit